MTFVNAISNTFEPGPMMLLRRALPNCPVGGATNAALLNHSPIEGFDRLTDCPGITSGRSVPLLPRFTSAMLPSKRGVNGRPEAIVQSPLHCQPPTIARNGACPVNQRLSVPKGSSHK